MPNLFHFSILLILFFACQGHSADVINKDLVISNADRSVDVSSQVVKISNKLTLTNQGKTAVDFLLFSIDADVKSNVAFLGSSVSDGKTPLKVAVTKVRMVV